MNLKCLVYGKLDAEPCERAYLLQFWNTPVWLAVSGISLASSVLDHRQQAVGQGGLALVPQLESEGLVYPDRGSLGFSCRSPLSW